MIIMALGECHTVKIVVNATPHLHITQKSYLLEPLVITQLHTYILYINIQYTYTIRFPHVFRSSDRTHLIDPNGKHQHVAVNAPHSVFFAHRTLTISSLSIGIFLFFGFFLYYYFFLNADFRYYGLCSTPVNMRSP